MNEYIKNNKVSGVYWLKSPIEALSLKIKIKPQEGIFQLPKFEEYNQPERNPISKNTTEEYIFKWQEKVFSIHEIDKYSNVHNCVTDTELSYFEKLEKTPSKGNKVFTYINEDYHLPIPFESRRENKLNILSSCFDKLNLKGDEVGRLFNDGSGSTTHLFRSNQDLSLETEQWIAMHIVYDNSEYNEESQCLFKQESILLSIYHSTAKNYLILSPDTNDIAFNPYTVDGEGIRFQYAVEVDYGGRKNGEELVMLLNKLHKKWEKKQKNLLNFTLAPLGKKRIYIAFEIVSARGFDMDNIYIEFHIKIPDNIQCNDTLQGKTHTTTALKTEDLQEWKYGHTVELELDIATGLEPPPIKVYLEAISTDWWGRHRTEGYTYLPLTLDPRGYSRYLSCTRPEELDTVEAESRRFFVGGCHLIKDLEVLDRQLQNSRYRFKSTGQIAVRWRTLACTRAVAAAGGEAGAALRAADAALRAYRRARARLAAAGGL
ncbi:tectonic-like complex member MKS1 [Epargyreus clarus]|uniref:tectonic-like complex member MKS1 n=1 Tax=Epargyreus clarus TaxID=520877 RepID=UPI003C2E2138